MASSPDRESQRPPVGTEGVGIWSFALFVTWVMLMLPQGALYFLLGSYLQANLPGSEILAIVAFLSACIFTGLALDAEFKSGISAINPRAVPSAVGNNLVWLAGAALAFPALLVILGVILIAAPFGSLLSAIALLITAATMLVTNTVSWLFCRYLTRQMVADMPFKRPLFREGAPLSVSELRQRGRATRAANPALAALAGVALFVFAYASRSLTGGDEHSITPLFIEIAVVFFVCTLLGWLAIRRYQILSENIRRNRLPALLDSSSSEQPAQPNWAARVLLTVLFFSLLAAAMPLNALVALSKYFQLRPPPQGAGASPTSLPGSGAGPSEAAYNTVGALLLSLLLIILFNIGLWLLRRWMKKHGIWQRMMDRARAMWRAVQAVLARIFGSRQEVAKATTDAASMEEPKDRFYDVFEDTEALAKIPYAQAIVMTFHLLIEFSVERGWLRRRERPPFEILRILLQKSSLDRRDLTRLTWAYARAAFSGASPSADDLSSFKDIWLRLKPSLKPPPEDEPATAAENSVGKEAD